LLHANLSPLKSESSHLINFGENMAETTTANEVSILDAITKRYTGDIIEDRFEGQGAYSNEHGKYIGEFKLGKFHGKGSLQVKGGKFEGIWEEGKLADGKFVFEDGLEYRKLNESTWNYCDSSDPRFFSEMQKGVPRDGPLKSYHPHTEKIVLPSGCYDVIEGYYDPKSKAIMSYRIEAEIRRPDEKEIDWIKKHCRVGK
jgi:hypothetical protein